LIVAKRKLTVGEPEYARRHDRKDSEEDLSQIPVWWAAHDEHVCVDASLGYLGVLRRLGRGCDSRVS
jgi:hypothetical protein